MPIGNWLLALLLGALVGTWMLDSHNYDQDMERDFYIESGLTWEDLS